MNKIEDIKKHKDGLDVLADIYRYAKLGFEALTPDDEALFRWYGIYTQRPASDGFFMVRLRIPGGDLTPVQLRTIADLSIEHGRGLADITVRQNIQLHWVRIESLPDILDRLEAVGLSTTDFFVGNRDFSNLPRKFKIAITGCAVRCVYPEINDIGMFAVPDGERGGVAFRTRVGGGLSTTPRFSKDLGVLIDPDEVVDLCGAIATVFREEGNRDNRKRARLKFLVEEWEIPRFRDEVEARLGHKLRRAAEPEAAPVTERDRSHLGIHGQHQEGFYYAGLSILGGRTSGDDLRRFADLAEEYGSGRIRTTNTQNIILLDIPERKLERLTRDFDRFGIEYQPSWSRKAIIACTGIQFCKLALAETKNRAVELNDYLENVIDLDDAPRISVTGCPNACGQHHICDVGLEGSLTTIDGVKKETFQVFLGGGVGSHETFGRRIGVRVQSEELAGSLARLFTRYKDDRIDSETFQEFCLRHTNAELVEYLRAPDAGAGCDQNWQRESGSSIGTAAD